MKQEEKIVRAGNKLHPFIRRFHYMDHQNLPYIQGLGVGTGHADYIWDGMRRKDQLVVMQYTLSGKGIFESGGKEYVQKAESFFLADIPGRFTYFGEDWKFIYIEFSPITKQWLALPNQACPSSSESFSKKLIELILLLENEEVSLYENAKLSFDLFLQIKEEVAQQKEKMDPEVQVLRSFIEENYQQDIGLDLMENHFHMSKFQIIRSFEEAFQYTPMAYLRKIRILKSLERLWDYKTIDHVAHAVGFSNGNYFAKVFKSEMGMTPTEYKESKKYNEE